jgi:hypothetical protein
VLPLIAIVLALVSLGAPVCRADSLQPEELQILAKAVSFMEPPLTGQPVVAIVFADGDAASHRDAEVLAGQVNAVRFGGVAVTPLVVSSAALAGTKFQMIITAAGVDSIPVIEAAEAHHVLCITADVDAVRAGHCTMAIRSSRKIEIFLNRDAAAQSGLSFATAFRMMVHEQ